MKTGNIIVGNDTDKIFTDKEGRLRCGGHARPYKLYSLHSTQVYSTHQNPLGITSLAAADGIVTSGLDDAEGASQRIEVIGIDGGEHTKGRLSSSYTQGNTTDDSCIVKVKLSTTNATWDQSGGWRLVLDILSGCITGGFTVFMPAFSMMEYSTREFYVACDGATYNRQTAAGFDKSMAGSVAATELMSNNESAGSDVVIEVASTTGFYVGNLVFVSDSANSEWSRITAIITDTSITVDTLTNSYTTAAGSALDIIDYVQTTPISPIQRGLFKMRNFRSGVNSGASFQFGIPHDIDPTEDLNLVLQLLQTETNAGAAIAKFRVQYVIHGVGDEIPQSNQYGTFIDTDITPPSAIGNYIYSLGSIPSVDHTGKHLLTASISRLGVSGVQYTGDLKWIALVLGIESKQLGYEA